MAVEAALEHVAPEDLVATTRTPDAIQDFAQRGVQVRYANFDEPESLVEAFRGIERMFMVSATNATGKRLDQHSAALEAVRNAGIEKIIFPSMPRVDYPGHGVSLTAREYREAEELLHAGEVPWCVLRDAPYTDLHVVERLGPPAIAIGQLRLNTADGRSTFISREDVARAAIAAIFDGEPGRTYDISGSELLTFGQVCETLSEVIDRRIEYVPLSDAEYEQEAREAGFPEMMVTALTGFGQAVRDGLFAVLTDDYLVLTGREPATLRETLESHHDSLTAVAAA
jgi:NAD(P)H dehydrogenase (quinone)